LVFLDDDVVVLGPIEAYAGIVLPDATTAFASGCMHWAWQDERFERFTAEFTVSDTGYLGELDVPCPEQKVQKTRKTLVLEQNATPPVLDCVARPIVEELDATFGELGLRSTAFNMGLNLIDVERWRSLGLTRAYEAAVRANDQHLWFPHDTLAFGLGLAELVLGKHSSCVDERFLHMVGLSFVSEEMYSRYGWSEAWMREHVFALHYNGGNKPWVPDANGPFDRMWLEYDRRGESPTESPAKFPDARDER